MNDNIISFRNPLPPTSQSTKEEIELFYEDLNKVLLQTKQHETNIIFGDFKAKIGNGKKMA